MARTEAMFPRTPSSPNVPVNNPPGRTVYPHGPRIKNFLDDKQDLEWYNEKLKEISSKGGVYWKNPEYIRLNNERNDILYAQYKKPNAKKQGKKETTLDDIAQILLAIAGYGMLLPGPYGTAYKAVARAGRRYARTAYKQRVSTGYGPRSGYTGNYRKPVKDKYGNRR